MAKIIRLYIKKSAQRMLGIDPTYRHCKMVMREMRKRGFNLADSYVRGRDGLDLFAILITCKALLRPTNVAQISLVSLTFLRANALKIFTECTTREEVLCKLYELKHTISNAMQYQLKFSCIINEKIATTRSLERIVDSTIFSVNCLDVNFINSNSLAFEEALDLLGYETPGNSDTLTTKQLQILIGLLLLRATLIAEQAVFGKLHVHLKLAINLLDRYIKKVPNHPPLELIKLVLLNIYTEDSNEYFLIKSLVASYKVLEAENINHTKDSNLSFFEESELLAA